MGVKRISYFSRNRSTNETVRILDYGYHETIPGNYSAQTIIDHYVLHCIIRGRGKYAVNGAVYHLRENDCFLLLPHVPISYQSDEQEPWVYYWVGFDGIDAMQMMQLCNITANSPVLHYEPVTELTELIRPMTELKGDSFSESYGGLGTFYLLCSRLMQHNGNIKPPSRKEYYVNKAVSLIQDSYYKNISVRSISDSIGLDRTYLYRIFKEIRGITVHQYITNLRLKRACSFLCDSALSYSEIAYYCGYLSEQYFSMAFKKNIGMTPSAYRKASRERPEGEKAVQ